MAADSPRQRILIDDDWRFIKGDPQGATENLAYPTAFSTGGRNGRAGANYSPTAGIAAYILPTGNEFIADPAKQYKRPDGNYGGNLGPVHLYLHKLLEAQG